MAKTVSFKQLLHWLMGERWRYTAALLVSMGIHLAVFLSYAPNFSDVRDNAVEFELVEGADQQPLAPEAAGPRTADPTPPDEDTPEEETPDNKLPDAPPPDNGIIVSDTDLPKDTKGEKADTEDTALALETDADTATEVATDSTIDSASDSASDVVMDSARDLDSESDVSTDTLNGDSETDGATDSQTDSVPQEVRIANSAAYVADTATDSGTIAVAIADTETAIDTAEKGNRFPGSAGAAAGDDAICLHDVFEYAKSNPTWMAWLSMQAFAGTRYEKGLANILKSFYLYNEMVAATEIDPMTELEGVLISADDFAQFDTYQVVATYNVGQDVLQSRLQKNMGTQPGFTLKPTPQGVSGIHQGSYRWDLVGSGRVLVASNAQKGSLSPDWPKDVTCMKSRPPFKGNPQKKFEKLVRSAIGPAAEGERWPVMVMATRDPGAAGMYYKPELAENFEWAILKGYFSEPIQITGEARFKDNPEVMAQVEAQVTALLSNPYIRFIPGLGAMVGKIEYRIENNSLHFTVPMTQSQADVLLELIQRYSQKLNEKFSRP